MATIQKRISKDGKPSYRVMVRLRGYPAQYATFTRKTDAKDWAKNTESAIKEGRHFKTREAKRHTFGEMVDRYSLEVLSRKPEKKREDQERHLAWWTDRLGSYALADVTPALLAEQREVLSREITHYGKERSAGTVNRYLISLSHVFTLASREWEWIEQNPLRKVRKLKEPRGRVRFLSEDERGRLLEACQECRNPRLYPLVVLALSTGARQGELLALRWGDLDWQRQVAVLHDSKNRERRALPIAGHAQGLLKEMAKVRRIDSDLIFAGPNGKANFPRTAWQSALRAAQIDDFRFHDLRHSAASYLAMSGATLAEIAEVLGHKTLAMVKRYSHLTEAHTAGVVARMNQRIFPNGSAG